MIDIKFIENKNLKQKPDFANVSFSNYTATDYMFMCDVLQDGTIIDPKIMPYGPLEMDPCAMVFHYAQETFEGMKAYKAKDGHVYIFRPDMNALRFQNSNRRLGMPIIEKDFFIEAVKKLVEIEVDWIPDLDGMSLYIRPFMFATQSRIDPHEANIYKFMIILSPAGAYGGAVLKPINIMVEDEMSRSVIGGTGFAKCGGNYGGSMLGQIKAAQKGYDQVLWLDGATHKYVEEVGTCNAMFVIDGKVVTASIDQGTVLPGITRDSIIKLLKKNNIEVEERLITLDELILAGKQNRLTEAFGTGTAAVVSPIGKLSYKDQLFFECEEAGPVAKALYYELTEIQKGVREDIFNWRVLIK